MTRLAHADVFDRGNVSVFHSINRGVRRVSLFGYDPQIGDNVDVRRLFNPGNRMLQLIGRWICKQL